MFRNTRCPCGTGVNITPVHRSVYVNLSSRTVTWIARSPVKSCRNSIPPVNSYSLSSDAVPNTFSVAYAFPLVRDSPRTSHGVNNISTHSRARRNPHGLEDGDRVEMHLPQASAPRHRRSTSENGCVVARPVLYADWLRPRHNPAAVPGSLAAAQRRKKCTCNRKRTAERVRPVHRVQNESYNLTCSRLMNDRTRRGIGSRRLLLEVAATMAGEQSTAPSSGPPSETDELRERFAARGRELVRWRKLRSRLPGSGLPVKDLRATRRRGHPIVPLHKPGTSLPNCWEPSAATCGSSSLLRMRLLDDGYRQFLQGLSEPSSGSRTRLDRRIRTAADGTIIKPSVGLSPRDREQVATLERPGSIHKDDERRPTALMPLR